MKVVVKYYLGGGKKQYSPRGENPLFRGEKVFSPKLEEMGYMDPFKGGVEFSQYWGPRRVFSIGGERILSLRGSLPGGDFGFSHRP